MIILYSGTPGSGKSLHSAIDILYRIKTKRMTIANFPVTIESEYFKFVDKGLTVKYLIDFSKEYFKTHKYQEGAINVYIDEAQLLFNCRDFTRKDRQEWLSFFTQHRHLGYDIIFMCQFERMLDRQIRYLIEYEYIHKKVKNFGWKGYFISAVKLSMFTTLFQYVKVWSPIKEKVDVGYFTYKKKYGKLYDTNRLFDNLGEEFKTTEKEKEKEKEEVVSQGASRLGLVSLLIRPKATLDERKKQKV